MLVSAELPLWKAMGRGWFPPSSMMEADLEGVSTHGSFVSSKTLLYILGHTHKALWGLVELGSLQQ